MSVYPHDIHEQTRQVMIELPKGATLPMVSEVEASGLLRVLLLAGAGLAVYGLLRSSWPFFLVGVLGWVVLLFRLFLFRMELREGFEEASLNARFELKRTSIYAGQTAMLQLVLDGVGRELRVYRVRLRHSAYVQGEESKELEEPWWLRADERNSYIFHIKAPVMGKFALHGAELYFEDNWKLFRTWRYVPAHAWLRVLPKIPLSRIERRGRNVRTPYRQQSGAIVHRVGTGSELRDIREYQPGDSRRSIVWKQSLRHGKLMCREFESEAPFTSYVLFDMSQSMREGHIGKRKLDHAAEVGAAFAKASLDQRDAVGMISFDGEVFRHDKPGYGKKQLYKVIQHLEEVQHVVEPEFANMPLSELCKLVGDFLFREGMLARNNGRSPARPKAIIEYVWDYLLAHPEMGFPQGWESEQELIGAVLRYYCRGVGLDLPYRYHQWVTYKAAGLELAIETAVKNLRSGQLIIVLSDLGDVLHWDGILRVLKLARQRRHHVVFLSPFSPWFVDSFQKEAPKDKSTLSKQQAEEEETKGILQEILTLEQWTWRRRVQKMMNTLGIPVLSVKPEDAPAILMERLHRLRLSNRG